ncbi:MAG: SRPBCC domain-containing protein [Actinomycetota bacterium]|nr:SRPBCC domain-containing protein [Actinomycetota bacterium]
MVRIDTATRVVDGPPTAVFAALVDADARTAWLPPAGMTGRFDRFDARPGGGYRLVLTYDDSTVRGKSGANSDVADVRFVEIDPPGRVVEETDFVSADPAFSGTMTLTWTVDPHPDGARVTVAAHDVPPGISEADHVAGMTSTLGNLDSYVRGQGCAPRATFDP